MTTFLLALSLNISYVFVLKKPTTENKSVKFTWGFSVLFSLLLSSKSWRIFHCYIGPGVIKVSLCFFSQPSLKELCWTKVLGEKYCQTHIASSPKNIPWMFCIKQVLFVLSVCICVSLCVFALYICTQTLEAQWFFDVGLANRLDSVCSSILIN